MIEINGVSIPTEKILSVKPVMGGRAVEVKWIEGDETLKRQIEGISASEVMMQITQARRSDFPPR